jgi:hypothetical protein
VFSLSHVRVIPHMRGRCRVLIICDVPLYFHLFVVMIIVILSKNDYLCLCNVYCLIGPGQHDLETSLI